MFINETKNDVENNVKASAAMIKKLKLIMVAIAVLLIVSGTVWLAFDLARSTQEEADIFTSLIIVFLGVVFLIFWILYNKILRRTLEKTMQGKEAIVRFEFSDDGFEIVSNAVDQTFVSTTKGNYYAITECREDKDLWLLYFNKATVYLMLKSGMQEGNAEEFTAFLKERLGIRYKVIFKQKKK